MPPLKDDKILVAWNGLMIAALARGSQASGEMSHARAAAGAADFILQKMLTPNGRLYRRYRQGELANPGYVDDYAFLIWGLLDLYETIFDVRYLSEAVRLQEDMSRIFGDPDGGFYYTGNDSEEMILREKAVYDGALPSSNSVAAMNLLRLGRMTGNPEFEKQADLLIRSFSKQVAVLPGAFTHFMQALDFALGPAREILIAGDISSSATKEMIKQSSPDLLPQPGVDAQRQRKKRRGIVENRAIYRADNFKQRSGRVYMRKLQLPKSCRERLRAGVYAPGQLSSVNRLSGLETLMA